MFNLILISILGYCFVTTKYFSWKVESTPFFTVSSIIALLYMAGLLNFLRPAALAIFYIGCGFFAWSVILTCSNPKRYLKLFLTPGILCFIISVFLLWFKVKNGFFNSWDEFNYWGIATKDIFINSSFIKHSEGVVLKSYPHASVLFHYFVDTAMGRFSEGIAYFAQNILLFAPLVVFFQKINYKKASTIVITLCFCYFSLFTFGHWSSNPISGGAGVFLSLFADTVLAVFFGMSISSYFLAEEKKNVLLQLLPVVICMPLIKDAGGLLTGILILIIITDQLLGRYYFKSKNDCMKERKGITIRIVLLIVFFITSCVATQTKILEGNLFSRLQKKGSSQSAQGFYDQKQRKQITLTAFKKAVKFEQVGAAKINISYGKSQEETILKQKSFASYPTPMFFWLFIFAMISVASFGVEKSVRKRQIVLFNGWLIVGLIIYLFAMFIKNLYASVAYEGLYLASFSRYVGMYFLSWCLVIYAFSLDAYSKIKSSVVLRYLFLLTLPMIVVLTTPEISFMFLFKPTSKIIPNFYRKKALKVVAELKKRTKEKDRVYILWGDSSSFNAFKHSIVRYELLPRYVNNKCWCLAKYNYMYGCKQSANEFAKSLQNYDYLVLIQPKEFFWEKYGKLFMNVEKTKPPKVNGNVIIKIR